MIKLAKTARSATVTAGKTDISPAAKAPTGRAESSANSTELAPDLIAGSYAHLSQPFCRPVPGSRGVSVFVAQQLQFEVIAALSDKPHDMDYAWSDDDELAGSAWEITVKQENTNSVMEPGRPGVESTLRLCIAQQGQLAAHSSEDDPQRYSMRDYLNADELRALFAGVAELRRAMVAAGFDV